MVGRGDMVDPGEGNGTDSDWPEIAALGGGSGERDVAFHEPSV